MKSRYAGKRLKLNPRKKNGGNMLDVMLGYIAATFAIGMAILILAVLGTVVFIGIREMVREDERHAEEFPDD